MVEEISRRGRRAHVGLEVADLARSIAFYRVLFGVEPTKVRPGYAKFEPVDPALNLSLSEDGRAAKPAPAWHLGIQVGSSAEVWSMEERLRAAGIEVRVERNTECCYAVQDKVWATDPDGHPWEVFKVLQADAGSKSPRREHEPAGRACCGGDGAAC